MRRLAGWLQRPKRRRRKRSGHELTEARRAARSASSLLARGPKCLPKAVVRPLLEAAKLSSRLRPLQMSAFVAQLALVKIDFGNHQASGPALAGPAVQMRRSAPAIAAGTSFDGVRTRSTVVATGSALAAAFRRPIESGRTQRRANTSRVMPEHVALSRSEVRRIESAERSHPPRRRSSSRSRAGASGIGVPTGLNARRLRCQPRASTSSGHQLEPLAKPEPRTAVVHTRSSDLSRQPREQISRRRTVPRTAIQSATVTRRGSGFRRCFPARVARAARVRRLSRPATAAVVSRNAATRKWVCAKPLRSAIRARVPFLLGRDQPVKSSDVLRLPAKLIVKLHHRRAPDETAAGPASLRAASAAACAIASRSNGFSRAGGFFIRA